MALFVNICLVVVGIIGAAVALKGETWNPHATKWVNKLTPTGYLAAACILASLIFGVTKEIQSEESSKQFEAQNIALRAASHNVQTMMLKENRLWGLGITVDTLDRRKEQAIYGNYHGYNSLFKLAAHVSTNLSQPPPAVGIEMLARYGPLGIHLDGVATNENTLDEQWFVWLYFGSEDAPKTMPLKFEKSQGFLVDVNFDENSLNHFWRQRPAVRSLFAHGGDSRSSFDPAYELGEFTIRRFGLLAKTTDAIEFALGSPNAPFLSQLNIPDGYLFHWRVALCVNDRSICNLRVEGDTLFEDQLHRLKEWRIDPTYQTHYANLLVPVPDDWQEYFPSMARNIRWLLYGQTEEPLILDPKLRFSDCSCEN